MNRFAYVLATSFVLGCMAAGAVLGALIVLIRCGLETVGGRRG